MKNAVSTNRQSVLAGAFSKALRHSKGRRLQRVNPAVRMVTHGTAGAEENT
jgi:hypothetical protein